MHEAAASCKDIARAPVTNLKPHGVRIAGYSYAMRHGMNVQIVTPYRVNHLQRYGVTVRGNVTSVYLSFLEPDQFSPFFPIPLLEVVRNLKVESLSCVCSRCVGRDSSACIATCYGLEVPGVESRYG
jgi:hypothetical protein